MSGFDLDWKGVAIIGPAVFLVILGLWLTLRSGVSGRQTVTRLRLAWENLSSLVVALMAWVLGLAFAQFAVGLRLGW
ncbi:MAG TPA: hypothetical protein VFT74_10275 [Isosphaeraceae bacterium]|nr:hypothetical protein [Isosphaeraceae bacterium]